MRLDLGQLLIGRLVYDEPQPALDDIRFERIIRGFAQHYEVTTHDATQFSFARGEGYLQISRGDAFGYVDSGTIERVGRSVEPTETFGGNVILLPPRYDRIRFALNIRVLIVYWAFLLLVGWMFIGGDWLFWLCAFVAAVAGSVWLIRRSLRTKLSAWLARESWN